MASRYLLLAAVVVAVMCCCLAAPRAAPRAAPVPLLDVTSACRCTREFNAVCGNDGQTYSNKCLLECARAQGSSRMGQGLRMVKMGPVNHDHTKSPALSVHDQRHRIAVTQECRSQ